MSESQEQWYRRMYKETGDENYLVMLNQITKNKETPNSQEPKDLSSFFKPTEQAFVQQAALSQRDLAALPTSLDLNHPYLHHRSITNR